MNPNALLLELNPGLAGLFSVAGVITLVWGLLNAFFGYKLFKVVLAVCGFLTGALIGSIPALLFAGDGAGAAAVLLIPVFGIIGAVLAVLLHKLGVFLSVGAMAFVIFYLLVGIMPVALVLGIVCGIIGVILEKYTIIVSTGLSGGFLAASGFAILVPPLGSAGTVAVGLLVGICGIAVQLLMERQKPAAAAAAAAVTAGTAYAARPQPQPQPTAAAAAARPAGTQGGKEIKCCSNCGSEISDGTSYCRKCGHMVLSEPAGQSCFCSQCGASMSSTANFCRKCGAARGI